MSIHFPCYFLAHPSKCDTISVPKTCNKESFLTISLSSSIIFWCRAASAPSICWIHWREDNETCILLCFLAHKQWQMGYVQHLVSLFLAAYCCWAHLQAVCDRGHDVCMQHLALKQARGSPLLGHQKMEKQTPFDGQGTHSIPSIKAHNGSIASQK